MATAKKTTSKKADVQQPQVESFTALDQILQDGDLSMGDRLRLLYHLQQTDSKIDRIYLLRGELPLEVKDLEDEIEGLKTRIANLQAEVKSLDKDITARRVDAEECRKMVAKYEAQQNNVKNNREYDSLSKEIEFQTLEAELAEKKAKEYGLLLKDRKEVMDQTKALMADREEDLKLKRSELDGIVTETAKEEEDLKTLTDRIREQIDERMLVAYDKVRRNCRNGLAVVTVKRDACGGCFNKIPPQRQLDIRMSKKIIVCEYCGRILVDSQFETEQTAENPA